MPSLEETIAAFYQNAVPTAPAAGPPVGVDPVATAVETLQRLGQVPGPLPPSGPPQVSFADTEGMDVSGLVGNPQAPGYVSPPPLAVPGQGSLTQVEPVRAAAPTFAPPKPSATVQGATGELSRGVAEAGQAAFASAQADQEAERVARQRIADVQTERATHLEQLNQQTQLARQRNEAQADFETAAWVQEMQDAAKKEPNPGRWWENTSSLGKALWLVGLAAGAGYVAMTPGAQNAALMGLKEEMANDMEEQRQRLARELSALKMKGETMRERQARNASDLRDDYTMGLGRLDALERAWMARAAVPGDADAAATAARAQALFAQMKLPYLESFRQERVAAANAAETRRFEMGKLAAQQRFAKSEREAEQAFTTGRDATLHQYKLEESPISASVAYRPGGPVPLDKEGKPIYSTLQSGVGAPGAGLVLKGPGGTVAHGTGEVRVDPKDFTEASKVVSKANERYTQLKQIADDLDRVDPGWLNAGIGTTDPALASHLTSLGYAIAKGHDPRVSNQDFSKGVIEGVGFDPDGNWLQRIKSVEQLDKVKELIQSELGAMPQTVSNSFRDYNHAEINGQGTEIVWDPKYLGAKEVAPRSDAQIEGAVNETPVPHTAKEYRSAAKTSAADASAPTLPRHDAAVIQAITGLEGRGPAAIAAGSKTKLDKVWADLKAVGEQLNAIDEGAKAAIFAEDVRLAGGGVKGDPALAALKDLTTEQYTALRDRYAELKNTYEMGSAIAADVEAQAKKTLDRVEARVRAMKQTEVGQPKKWVTDEWIRAQVRREGITSAADAEAIVQKFKNYDPLRGK